MPAKVIVTQIIEELRISQRPFVERNIGTVEEITQCLAERRFRDPVFLDQQTFQVSKSLQGFLNSFHEIRLADEPLVNQGIVGTWFDGFVGRLLHDSYFVGPEWSTMSDFSAPSDDRNNSQYRSIFVVHNEYQKGSAILIEPICYGSGNELVGEDEAMEL